MRRLRAEFQEELRANVILRYTPHLQFTLDHSVEQGDRVLRLLEELGGGEDDFHTETQRDRGTEEEGEGEDGARQDAAPPEGDDAGGPGTPQ